MTVSAIACSASATACSAIECRGSAITPLRPALARVLLPFRPDGWFSARVVRVTVDLVGLLSRSPYSVLMDRAGPHRRLAIAMPVLSLALIILALANVLDSGPAAAQWFPQVALAISVIWALRAMLAAGRLIDQRGMPHAGLFAVGASVLGWAAIRFGASAPQSSTLVAIGIGFMAVAATLFAGAERRSDRPAMLGGRLLLSVGALVLGAALLGGVAADVWSGAAGHPGHVLGLALLGLAFVLLAIAEARVLVRLVGYAIDRGRPH